MSTGLRRYEFSERLAQILGESRRDLRFRVTMLVSGGIVKPGPRGRGSPLATPAYGAHLLLGTMAAPQQAYTTEAIRCYWNLKPVAPTPEMAGPGIVIGPPTNRPMDMPATLPFSFDGLCFGECLNRLLDFASFESTHDSLADGLFGVWVNRSCPVAGLRIAVRSEGQRSVITQRFELADREFFPSWLDPNRDGVADPGLLHTVFLPAHKLIEIGRLTTSEKRGNPMLNLGPKIAKLADLVNLARQDRYRVQWEKLLSSLMQVQAWTNQVGAEDSRLAEVTDFGANPGQLRMFTYVPENLPPRAPLVVALHGCTQTATSYDQGAGWSRLADRFGFALVFPQQHWTNNPLRCFNWFRPEDTARDSGEPSSIRRMTEWMLHHHDLDGDRVYVTGLSSGGAMTSVMLATYPDVFAGGAIVAGVPYHAADGLQEAFECIFTGNSRSGDDWGDRVRAASSHRGPWPRVSVWHGDADTAVAPVNAEESIKQWANVHGLSFDAALEDQIDGHPHRVWKNARGESVLESYTITGMAHGQPLDVNHQERSCGTAGPFFNDVGISSAYRIAEFWQLPEVVWEKQSDKETVTAAEKVEGEVIALPPVLYSGPSDTKESRDGATPAGDDSAAGGSGWGDAGTENTDAKDGSMPLGIDVRKIVSASLEMAGLLKNSGTDARTSGTAAPLGIDIPGIISESLRVAGVLINSEPADSDSRNDASPEASDKTKWQGEGWEMISNRSGEFRTDPLLFGYASSGNNCEIGSKVRSVSREISLGNHPALSYVRRLNLHAAVNDYTRARFSVLVDGLAIDEVSVVGMAHTEGEWMRRTDIDLSPFANRTVTLTFEVAAHSNVCNEVFAKAWVDRVHVRDTATSA
uniref:Esterase, PHB depolymerase family n=1 Tax=Candidatus Kentrum sp. DK TaxID=2126562 RepID=A0A450S114_9GAMM|nr:MAG: esterase, PHB depolymerase family [Candidatus Kentron sp. DK]